MISMKLNYTERIIVQVKYSNITFHAGNKGYLYLLLQNATKFQDRFNKN